ncbi:uncharacterized protein LOC128553841 [Mercenaria mercenaria]|uniref:uncharacterized protein LOC128553841 n=1 Tax=Mercenaria mercenaria TaxID=6596 RepID=UPI00234E9B11|nr:uncharacterized protein LOC128553841 [Mercenaria mercenaria]
MATTNHEKYSRLVLMLVRGGTKITRALLEKRIKDLTPQNHEPDPWTIDQFLNANKQKIIGTQTGRAKERMLFPGTTCTNVEDWDLYMFCFVLIDICGVFRTVRMDVDQLRKIRNKLCHLNEPSINSEKYEHYVDKIEVIFDRLLAELNDRHLMIAIAEILKAAKEEPLSFKETLIVVHKFFSMDAETREILSQQSKDIENVMEKVMELNSKVDLLLQDRVHDANEIVEVPGKKI